MTRRATPRPAVPSPLVGLVAAGLRDVCRLVVPVECPGCDLPDVVLCRACAAHLAGPVHRCEADVPRLDRMDGRPPPPVWAAAPYVGPVRGVVVAWKDRGRADLTRHLLAAARRVGRAAAVELAAAGVRAVHVVPVPTTLAARRRRGGDLVRRLAVAVARGLRDGGVRAVVAPVLRRRRARDQVGLGARGRGRNARGTVLLRRRSAPVHGPHLLVDDVVTTGSTLAACEVALRAAGGLVVGAAVLAATPSPGGASA